MVQVKPGALLTIGQLAEASGVPTSTIRFWERRELLTPTARVGGQRRYAEDALSQVGVLRLCQDAGFTLAEIRVILDAGASSPAWRELVRDTMARIEENLRRLNKAHGLLSHALECPHEDITRCPRFRAAVDHRTGPRPAVDDRAVSAHG